MNAAPLPLLCLPPAGRGWAVSVYFHYMQGVANNLSLTHVPEIAPRQDSLAGGCSLGGGSSLHAYASILCMPCALSSPSPPHGCC